MKVKSTGGEKGGVRAVGSRSSSQTLTRRCQAGVQPELLAGRAPLPQCPQEECMAALRTGPESPHRPRARLLIEGTASLGAGGQG